MYSVFVKSLNACDYLNLLEVCYGENLRCNYYRVLCDFKDISPIEVEDVKGMIPLLARCYPDEIKRAVNVSDG